MRQPSDPAPWERYEDDDLTDSLDDGSGPLAPMQFDPLCELHGEPWPNSPIEAASYEYEIAHWLNDAQNYQPQTP